MKHKEGHSRKYPQRCGVKPRTVNQRLGLAKHSRNGVRVLESSQHWNEDEAAEAQARSGPPGHYFPQWCKDHGYSV